MPFGVETTRFAAMRSSPTFRSNLTRLTKALSSGEAFMVTGNSDAVAWATLNSYLRSNPSDLGAVHQAWGINAAERPAGWETGMSFGAQPHFPGESAAEEALFYGDLEYHPASFSIPGQELVPVGGGEHLLPAAVAPVVITAAALGARFGPVIARAVVGVLRNFGVRTRIAWNSLPGWVKAILITLGISEGADLLFDEGPGDVGLLPSPIPGVGEGLVPDFFPFFGGGVEQGTILQIGAKTYMVVKSWRANGVLFARFTDGSQAAQDKDGVWKRWVPKKPIVLFSDGASDLKTAIKASKALGRQAKGLAKMMRRAGYDVKRS